MTPAYQGRALARALPRARPARLRRMANVLVALVALVVLAHVPWTRFGHAALRVSNIKVRGLRYLDPAAVLSRSGLATGTGWLDADLDRARQRLLEDSRIRDAHVARVLPRSIEIRVEERVPVLLVRRGTPWELDADGVLLAPLEEGAVADVPLVSGVDARGLRPGTWLATAEVQRALAWAAATAPPDLELSGRISEIDVSDHESTGLVLMNGTRVVSTAWPPGVRTLSALRVVLADLEQRGGTAEQVDLRFHNQVIVRPVPAASRPGTGVEPS